MTQRSTKPKSQLVRPSMTREALAVWNRMAPTLEADGRLLPGDEDLFAEYCRVSAMAAQALKQLNAHGGILLLDEERKAQKHPAWNGYREAVALKLKLAAQWGLTPASRKSLGIKRKSTGLAGVRDRVQG